MHHLIVLFDCETASLLNQKVYPEIKHTEDTIFFSSVEIIILDI